MLSLRSSPLVVLAAFAVVQVAQAQLSTFRGTIPGSLHQCEETNLYFFDSGNERPLDVLFLRSSDVPNSLRSGEITLTQALEVTPLLAIDGITTPDASQYNFELQIAQGEVFEVFGFLPDGTGKDLSLTRTVQTPLPSASNCLRSVQTTISGVAGAAATTTARGSAATATTTTRATTSQATSAGATSTPSSSTSSSGSSSAAPSPSASSNTIPSSAGSTSASMGFVAAVIGAAGAALELFLI